MSALAEQLKEILAKPEGETLSTLDLMSLPAPVRRVVNLMLRKVKVTYEDLCRTVAELPEDKRLSAAQLDEILDALCQVGWLELAQSGGVVTYRVSLSPKPGSVSADSPLDILEKENTPAVSDISISDAKRKSSSPPGGLGNWIKGFFGSSKSQR